MERILYIASVILVALTLWDVFITVFSSSGAGPLTRFWSQRVWNGLLFIHRRWPLHRLLSLIGPLILLGSILLWYALLGLGVFLAFAASPDSVINTNTGTPVDLLGKLYFVSNTISSLGYGDLVPSSFPWTLVSTVATLAATVVLTVSLSYVLSVLSAAIERKKLAQGIFGLGRTVVEIIERARLSEAEDSLKNYVLSLSSETDHQALKHLAYPILKFFHAKRADLSPARALLLLADTFFILGIVPEEHRPPVGVQQLVESSISNYAEFASTRLVPLPSPGHYPEHLLDAARLFGVEEAVFKHAFEAYLPRRNRLVALCREDGWNEIS
jgi:hypothetical protein